MIFAKISILIIIQFKFIIEYFIILSQVFMILNLQSFVVIHHIFILACQFNSFLWNLPQ